MLIHTRNRPVLPGAIIGYRKDGRPIHLIAGGSETATETPPAPEASQTPEPATQAPQQTPAAPKPSEPQQRANGNGETAAQEPDKPAEPASVDQLPDWAQKLVRDTRNEAAANRAKAKEHADALSALEQKSQSQLDGIAKALGLKPEEATPEQIMAERDAEKANAAASAAQARATRVELAVFRAAKSAGADGDALLDSRSFVAKLDGLDPAADDFRQRVGDLIKAATEEDARYKAAPPLEAKAPEPAKPEPPAVPKSGGEFTGSPSQPRQLTEEDAKHMTASEVADALKKGLFAAEGFGASRKSRR